MPQPSRQPAPGGVPAWLPWAAAPIFFLLPLGGCGLALSTRPAVVAATPAAGGTADEPPLVPVVPVATVATVATVVTTARR